MIANTEAVSAARSVPSTPSKMMYDHTSGSAKMSQRLGSK